jgi:hypothetical protein
MIRFIKNEAAQNEAQLQCFRELCQGQRTATENIPRELIGHNNSTELIIKYTLIVIIVTKLTL